MKSLQAQDWTKDQLIKIILETKQRLPDPGVQKSLNLLRELLEKLGEEPCCTGSLADCDRVCDDCPWF